MTGIASAEDRLETLSNEQTELLKLLLERESRQTISPCPRHPDSTGRVRLPTSWAQQRLWFIDQLEGGCAAYHIHVAVRLRGLLDREGLQRALNTLVQRHEVLRTVFVSAEGDPKQEIAAQGRFALPVIDLRRYEKTEREAQLAQQRIAEAQAPFDLRRGPLIRGQLLQVEADEHVLLITMHHIIADGWSMAVFIRELVELYSAYREGRPAPLAPLRIQYADYAQWQTQWLRGEALEKQLSYWRQQLSGAAPQLELPTDRPRPAVQSYRGEKIKLVLDAGLTAELRACAQKHEMTLFMVLYAAWAILLSRLSGQPDVIIGTPIANRQRSELEGLIGFFVNTLVLRLDVQGDLRVSEFLQRAKEVTLAAYDHQDAPFEQVVEALQPDRNLSRNPLFQVMLVLQNAPESELRLPGLTVSFEESISQSAMFDLHLLLEEQGDQIVGSLYYAVDLFNRATVERWAACFSMLLRGVARGVNARIGDLPILPDSERRQVTELFNATQVPYPQEKLIHELFEEQVERTPEAVAVVYEGRSLTYAELNAKANQLARYLNEKGVGPDRLVGICVERSLEMVIGLLGILKAGGAYVPLDPTYPPERLAYMVRDAAPRMLLIQEHLRSGLPNTAAELISLDEGWSDIGGNVGDGLNLKVPGLCSEHLAYVIYTSGSTGEPKGAMNEHRAVVNRLLWMQDEYRLTGEDRVLQKTPFSFDVSVWEFFWTLLSGARLILARPDGHKDPLYLQQLIQNTGVTTLHFVPSMLQSFLDQHRTGECQSLQHVVCSGEELSATLQKRFFESLPWARLSNLYGPTEAAIDVTAWECDPRDPSARVPIGGPIANVRMYVLDRCLQPVPIGVPGEIYIGGAGVGRGYLNRPELSAQRFIGDPFSDAPRARLYKTGDLGRWRPDGAIEYLGRNDHQVKVRGYRIELGEIEAQIAQHPLVKEVAVIAHEVAPGEKRLIAYIVGDRKSALKGTSEIAPEKLRTEIVGEWEKLYEETYGSHTQNAGPSFVGWNSSYTGEPIPEDQMQEWLTCTVARIRELQPKNVLEIGCGVGLLLQHVAPHCSRYVATDFSASALGQVRRWMGQRDDLRHVELLHRSATELQDLEAGSFDTVVLNSVVQYFPDIEYLVTVLQEAARLLGPGGKIFVGDVRNLQLLPIFHSAVQLSKAAATVNVGQLRRRIARAMLQEKELVIDPQFFHALPKQLPKISTAKIQIKRGRAPSELTRYRYDVVLQTGTRGDRATSCDVLDWKSAAVSEKGFEEALRQRRWAAVRLVSIPNGRLAREAAAQKLIESVDQRLDVATLRRQLNDLEPDGVDPETLWELARVYGYDAQLSWGSQGSPECFEIHLFDRARADGAKQVSSRDSGVARPWNTYANDPLESSFRQQLIPQLREYLKARLPDYMLPSAWVPLKHLPVAPNGKLDRHALPIPQDRPEEMGEYLAPRTEVERSLAEIWSQLLRVDQVGVRDNFFELGGHSLLGVKLVAKIAERLRVRLTVVAIFQYPTIEHLARIVESLRLSDSGPAHSEGRELEEGVL